MRKLAVFFIILSFGLTAFPNRCAAQCRPLSLSAFPVSDRPFLREEESLRYKPAYRFYYGIGTPVDYAKARKAAFFEWSDPEDGHDPYSGADILLMIYANGYGVRRNLDLCLRLSCGNVRGSKMEMQNRADHLNRMMRGDSLEIFDLGDDITSSYMLAWTADLHSERDSVARAPILNSLLRTWPRATIHAYRKARKTATLFFNARLGSEIELSGENHIADAITEMDSLEKNFMDQLLAFTRCSSATDPDGAAAESKSVTQIYQKILEQRDVSASSIRNRNLMRSQRSWLSYHEAMLRLAAQLCPGKSTDDFDVLLSRERQDQLLDLLRSR